MSNVPLSSGFPPSSSPCHFSPDYRVWLSPPSPPLRDPEPNVTVWEVTVDHTLPLLKSPMNFHHSPGVLNKSDRSLMTSPLPSPAAALCHSFQLPRTCVHLGLPASAWQQLCVCYSCPPTLLGLLVLAFKPLLHNVLTHWGGTPQKAGRSVPTGKNGTSVWLKPFPLGLAYSKGGCQSTNLHSPFLC